MSVISGLMRAAALVGAMSAGAAEAETTVDIKTIGIGGVISVRTQGEAPPPKTYKVPVTPSAAFQACAEAALDKYIGPGSPDISTFDKVKQHGVTLEQFGNKVRASTDAKPASELASLASAIPRAVAATQDCTARNRSGPSPRN